MRKPQATVLAVFSNVARYAIPVVRNAISVTRKGGNLLLSGTVGHFGCLGGSLWTSRSVIVDSFR